MSDLIQKYHSHAKALIKKSKGDQTTRILSIDFGLKKMGLALSDPSKIIASPLTVLMRKNIKDDINKIRDIIREHNVSLIIMGMPFELDETIGETAELVLRFGKKLSEKTKLEIGFIDERFSTFAVTEDLINAGMKRRKRDKIDDKIAASYILQQFLDNIDIT